MQEWQNWLTCTHSWFFTEITGITRTTGLWTLNLFLAGMFSTLVSNWCGSRLLRVMFIAGIVVVTAVIIEFIFIHCWFSSCKVGWLGWMICSWIKYPLFWLYCWLTLLWDYNRQCAGTLEVWHTDQHPPFQQTKKLKETRIQTCTDASWRIPAGDRNEKML